MRARSRLYATANSEEYKNEPVGKEEMGKKNGMAFLTMSFKGGKQNMCENILIY